jgi:hypothetical protein
MGEFTDKTPKRHGELYFNPPLASWKEEALRNREKSVKALIWGQSALKVRSALKLPANQPLILSGHQPVFFHPGLWVKCLAASYLAESVQGTACHLLTDTALPAEYPHYLPEVEENGKARMKTLQFFKNKEYIDQEKTTPYCLMPAPDHEAVKHIFSDAQVYCPSPVKKAMGGIEERFLGDLTKNPTWNQFHVSTLKYLDGLSQTQRNYIEGHRLWESEPYYEFLAHWMSHLPELCEAYNKSLADYRVRYGIKHDLTPLPNLKFENWWFEIPFWGVTKYNQRQSLWAKDDGRHLVLKIKGGEGTFQANHDNLQGELATLPIKIWPKALPQTFFCRMYLCDFFIHGTGGSAYEEVNDLFMEKVLGVKPPAFGTATATWLVDPKESESLDKVVSYGEKILTWERLLEKNPESLFNRVEAWKSELPAFMHPAFQACLNDGKLAQKAAEKGKWLALLQNPAQKPQASAKIKEINLALVEGLTEALKAVEKGKWDIEQIKQIHEILSFRLYPYFCYSPDAILDLKTKVRALIPQT